MKDCEHGVPFWGLCTKCKPEAINQPVILPSEVENKVEVVEKKYAIMYTPTMKALEFYCLACGSTLKEKEPHTCKGWEAMLVNLN